MDILAKDNIVGKLPLNFYKELTVTLQEEITLLESLKQNLKQQRTSLLSHDLSAFVKVLEEQQILIWEAKAKGESRDSVLKTYLNDPTKLHLSQLISEAPEKFKSTLVTLKADFNSFVQEINQYRDSNRALIEKSLKFLDAHLSKLQRLYSCVYEKNGEVARPNDSTLNKQV